MWSTTHVYTHAPCQLQMPTGLAMAMRVPLGVQLSAAAVDIALGRSLTLAHLEELDKEVRWLGCARADWHGRCLFACVRVCVCELCMYYAKELNIRVE